MTISKNILAKMDQVQQEIDAGVSPDDPNSKTRELHNKAVAAILNGNDSDEWVEYMKLFAGDPTNEAELARLIPTDGTTDANRQDARAYLVAGGTCLMATTTKLLDPVTTRLD
jgi:hypothetical protein